MGQKLHKIINNMLNYADWLDIEIKATYGGGAEDIIKLINYSLSTDKNKIVMEREDIEEFAETLITKYGELEIDAD